MFRCTWCCEVGVDVTCGGVVYCVLVIKMCVGVDVLVGILGVRWVLTYSVTYLVKYMVMYLPRGSLAKMVSLRRSGKIATV